MDGADKWEEQSMEHRHELPIVCDPYHCFVHVQWPASVLVASITGGVALVVFLVFAV